MPNATERKALIACALAGGVLCSFPRAWIAAISLWVIGAALAAMHVLVSRREAKLQKPQALPANPAPPPSPEAASALADTPKSAA
jgi:hypothetical protein